MKSEMSSKIKRLSSRLLLANLLFLMTMALVVDLVIYFGFRQAEGNATSSSAAALTDQGRDALRQMTEQEATFADRQLAEAASLGQVSADYLLAMQDADGRVPWDVNQLATASAGQRYDANPDRQTEVWIGPDTPIDDQMQRDLGETAVFNTLFPALIDESPDAIAIYYMGANGLGRYYPVNDLIERLPSDFSIPEQPFYTLAGPAANPVRTMVWSPPYKDFAGLGPIVTASTPIYRGEDFRGVIGVDISLVQLIERLNNLSPTTSGYAFLVDNGGRLVAASPNALNALLGPGRSATLTETLGIPLNQSANPQVLAALEQMRQEKSGLVETELNGQPVLLAHAPLPTVGWQLGLVAPVAEIAGRSQAVATTIQQDANDTLQSTTLVLTAFFLIVLLLVGMVNRRMIIRRVEALAGGVQTIASGDLDVRIPPLGEDEIGLLGQSINDMAGQLAAARDELEARVAQRTQELAALYDVTAVASASLNLDDVLEQSLDRVLEVMGCTIGTIHLLDEESQQLEMATWRNVPAGLRARTSRLAVGEGIAGQIVAQKEPIVLSDMVHDPRALPDAAVHVTGLHAYLGVPMRAKGEVVGVLSVVGSETRQFTVEETALMVSIGDQVGVAVENARLYRQAEELAVMQERQRLARELHDAVTQSVYSATLLAATGQRAVAAEDWAAVANFLVRLQTITGQALKELRLLVYELRPSALENAGLVEALQHRLDAVEARAGIQAQLLMDDDVMLNDVQETALYRVAVEALNNALKHAAATAVSVRITHQNGAIALTVADDGRGFAATAVADKGGVGLHSMQERARQLGGELMIESEVGEGTAVILRLPQKTAKDMAN